MAASTGRHDERELLTWYVTGTLAAAETAALESHLQVCESCRREVAEIRLLKGAMHAAIESRPTPSGDLFARVPARIQASEPVRAATSPGLRVWWSQLAEWATALLSPRLAPALALGLIVLQFGVLAVLATGLYQARYRGGVITQSGPEDTRPPAGGVRLRLAFQDTATAAAIRTALQDTGARIVDGPSAAGFYVVAVPAGPDGERASAALRGNTAVVRFVEEIRSN